jgi:hypothetical protein
MVRAGPSGHSAAGYRCYMPERKSLFRKFMGLLSDARNLAWAALAVPAGASAVSTALLGASNFLAAMQPGWRVGLIIGLGLMLFGLLVVPAALVARRIAVKSGLASIASTGQAPAVDQPKQQLAQANQRNDPTAEVARFEAENAKLRGQLENAKLAVINRETWAISCNQKLRYGEELWRMVRTRLGWIVLGFSVSGCTLAEPVGWSMRCGSHPRSRQGI